METMENIFLTKLQMCELKLQTTTNGWFFVKGGTFIHAFVYLKMGGSLSFANVLLPVFIYLQVYTLFFPLVTI